ncbi:MAG: hypothetical protein N2045_13860 [Fimbriimonadales bacterium]|nr:hypothetical protein [Fimbriimonadales bacterium]
MKTYIPALMTEITTQAQYDAATEASRLAWARTWTRFLLRDIPNEAGVYPSNGLEDIEYDAVLRASQITHETIAYYAPHIVASRLLQTDPTRWVALAMSGYSETRPDAALIAARIRQQFGALLEPILPAAIRPQSGLFAITF